MIELIFEYSVLLVGAIIRYLFVKIFNPKKNVTFSDYWIGNKNYDKEVSKEYINSIIGFVFIALVILLMFIFTS